MLGLDFQHLGEDFVSALQFCGQLGYDLIGAGYCFVSALQFCGQLGHDLVGMLPVRGNLGHDLRQLEQLLREQVLAHHIGHLRMAGKDVQDVLKNPDGLGGSFRGSSHFGPMRSCRLYGTVMIARSG